MAKAAPHAHPDKVQHYEALVATNPRAERKVFDAERPFSVQARWVPAGGLRGNTCQVRVPSRVKKSS